MVEQGGLVIRMSAETDIGKRPEQQDSVNASLPYIQEDIGVLCALADGVGGLTNGKQASQAVVDTMVSVFHQSSIADTPEQILLRGCQMAQAAVRDLQETPGECGSTLVAVIVRKGRGSFISGGDSRIYLLRGGGLIQLTRDQNRGRRIDMQIGLERLPEEARTDRKRAALTAYMGMEELTRTDRGSSSFAVIPGDRIALMSDGVYGTLSEDEIAEILGMEEEKIAVTMIERTLGKGNPHQDNCSVAVIDVSRRETDGGEG